MSEYQYYGWQAIDRSLTARELEEVDLCWLLASSVNFFVSHYTPSNNPAKSC